MHDKYMQLLYYEMHSSCSSCSDTEFDIRSISFFTTVRMLVDNKYDLQTADIHINILKNQIVKII